MGMTYWIVLWVVMFLAFALAWMFIVKGCEAMDAHHPNDDRLNQDSTGHPDSSG